MADTALTLPHRVLGAGRLKMAGDDRLADLAAAGDDRAFAVIFERHHQALYRYCRSILGHSEDAADALQSTMLRAIGALRGEKRTIALKPWLFRIAHNESISLLRRRRPQADVQDESLGLSSVGPEADADMRARVGLLFEDLRELPERQRSALVMRELSGLSYEEIAAALHTSTGAATQAVFGARKALMEFAEGRDMGCEDIQRQISRRDGRVLASRKIRSHLRECEPCSTFKAMITARERDFAVLVPPLPAVAAAAMLQGLQSGGGLGGGGLTSAGAAGGSGQAMATAMAAKFAPMLVAVAAGAGAGAIAAPGGSSVSAPAGPEPLVRAADDAFRPAGSAPGRERSVVLRAGAGGRGVKLAPAAAVGAQLVPATASDRAAQTQAGTAPADAPATRGPARGTGPAKATGPGAQRAPAPAKDRPASAPERPAPESPASSSAPAATTPPVQGPAPSAPSNPPTAPDLTPPSTPPTPTVPPSPTTPPPDGDDDSDDGPDRCHRKGHRGGARGHCDD